MCLESNVGVRLVRVLERVQLVSAPTDIRGLRFGLSSWAYSVFDWRVSRGAGFRVKLGNLF